MARHTRALWLIGHAACAALAAATWRVGTRPARASSAPPPAARWSIEERGQDFLVVRDLLGGKVVAAPNPLPRLAPLRIAPGFNPNFWAIADAHRVKVISLETGEAVVNFETPLGGVNRLVWLDEDRLAIVPNAQKPWLIHRVSTGRRTGELR